MNSRIYAYDYIRVISMIGILICHSCYVFSDYSIIGIGRYLGATYNFLFLILSAFLLGASWERQGNPKYKFTYVGKRIAKLSKSYYPYLAILFVFLYFSEDYFSLRNVISHFLYLPWFDKIQGFGHLWFLTMIAICYFGVYAFSKFNHQSNILNNKKMYIGLAAIAILADYYASNYHLPGYLFPYLIGYIYVYKHANKILVQVNRLPFAINIVQAIVINSAAIWLFVRGLFDTNWFASYLVGIICAISMFCFLYGLFRNARRITAVEWVSGISFEIYLVHEFFLGKFCVYKIFDNPIVGFVLLTILSIAGGLAVKYFWLLVNYISRHFKQFAIKRVGG